MRRKSDDYARKKLGSDTSFFGDAFLVKAVMAILFVAGSFLIWVICSMFGLSIPRTLAAIFLFGVGCSYLYMALTR